MDPAPNDAGVKPSESLHCLSQTPPHGAHSGLLGSRFLPAANHPEKRLPSAMERAVMERPLHKPRRWPRPHTGGWHTGLARSRPPSSALASSRHLFLIPALVPLPSLAFLTHSGLLRAPLPAACPETLVLIFPPVRTRSARPVLTCFTLAQWVHPISGALLEGDGEPFFLQQHGTWCHWPQGPSESGDGHAHQPGVHSGSQGRGCLDPGFGCGPL